MVRRERFELFTVLGLNQTSPASWTIGAYKWRRYPVTLRGLCRDGAPSLLLDHIAIYGDAYRIQTDECSRERAVS